MARNVNSTTELPTITTTPPPTALTATDPSPASMRQSRQQHSISPTPISTQQQSRSGSGSQPRSQTNSPIQPQHERNTSSSSSPYEYYPSWLPQRPLNPPPPASTSTTIARVQNPYPGNEIEEIDIAADPELVAELARVEAYAEPDPSTPNPPRKSTTSSSSVPSSSASAFIRRLGGRKATPRPIRIVSTNSHSPARALVALGDASPVPERSPQPSPRPEVAQAHAPFHRRVWSRVTRRRGALPAEFASPMLGADLLSPPPPSQPRRASRYPYSPTPSPAVPPLGFSGAGGFPLVEPTFKTRHLQLAHLLRPSLVIRFWYRLWILLVLAHIPLQLWFDFTAVWVLVDVSRHPSSSLSAIGTTSGSSRPWSLATAAYIGCTVAWLVFVVVLYEGVYGFVRQWRVKRPRILPIYLSSAAFNYAAMTSYEVFCFLFHIRWGLFDRTPAPVTSTFEKQTHAAAPTAANVNSAAIPPQVDTVIPAVARKADVVDGDESDDESHSPLVQFLAESCYLYAQNWPTAALLLPRAALALALLFAFSSAQVSRDTSISSSTPATARDPTYFRVGDGALTAYARGVLMAGAIWAAWRILVVLASWFGLWILSGHACAGICGPRYPWEEDEYLGEGDRSYGRGPATEKDHLQYVFSQQPGQPASPLPYARRQTYSSYGRPLSYGYGVGVGTPRSHEKGESEGTKAATATASASQGTPYAYPHYRAHPFGYDFDEHEQTYKGPPLPWRWREHTRQRVQEAWEFCLVGVAKPSSIGVRQQGGLPVPAVAVQEAEEGAGEGAAPGGFEGIDRVLAAVGFPSQPTPARRGVLSQDLFVGPPDAPPPLGVTKKKSSTVGPAVALGAGLVAGSATFGPSAASPAHRRSPSGSPLGSSAGRKGKSKRRTRSGSEVLYPFIGKGAQVSSDDDAARRFVGVPFPPSPVISTSSEGEAGAHGEDEEDADTGAEGSDEPTSGSGSSRRTDSNAQSTSSSSRRLTLSSERASGSMSSLGQPVSSRYPFQFRTPPGPGGARGAGLAHHSHSESQSTGNTGTGTGTGGLRSDSAMTQSTGNRESTGGSSGASLSMSLGSPVSPGPGSPGSFSIGSGSGSVSPLGAGIIPMPPRHPQARGRGRAGSVPVIGSGSGYHPRSSLPPMPLPPLPSPSARSTGAQQGQMSDAEIAPDRSLEGHGVEDESFEDEGEGEGEDVVGLLSPSVGPSPKSSLSALRHRATSSLSLTGHPQRTRRAGSTASLSGQSSSSGSGARSRVGSSRSRAGSMISVHVRSRAQSLLHGLGAASHSSLELLGTRSRANSSMARLEEDVSLDAHDSSNGTSQEFGGHGGWVQRARRDDQSHSRSGSGNISDAVQSIMSASTSTGTGSASANENYTFGHPLRTQWHDEERHGELEPQSSLVVHSAPSPIPESPPESLRGEPSGLQSRASDRNLNLLTPERRSSQAPSEEATVSALTPREGSEEPEDTPRAPYQPGPTIPLTIPGSTRRQADRATSEEDMISTAPQSFVTMPATLASQTTDSEEARTVSSWGGGVGDRMQRHAMGEGSAWGPA
ncbi:hypothetical protein HGRIS_010845 [Hohenbuehelia grisea]|uniref:Proteophosphoglycan ppg4 n=1 Tax=Hohenbuehelia grisea TaxID=104357 RepID=A0ABR3IYA0_9AGAR